MTAKAHTSYKSSAEPWVIQIPAHWEEVRAKHLFGQRRERARLEDPQLAATQAYGVIPQDEFMEREGQKVVLALAGTSGFSRVHVDDFVISLRSFQGGIEHSAYAGCVTPAYTVLKPSGNLSVPYYRWLLKSAGFVSALNATTEGIREGKTVPYSSFGQIHLPVPPFEEQLRIAAFLDHETARIDELVREQERLKIQLLEKRSVVISAASTTGLRGDAVTRDSEVTWLGEISREWPLVRLLHVSRIRSGLVDPIDERFANFTLIAPNHVESETGRLLELSSAREQAAISGKYRCFKGDVIYSKIRPALAKACISPGDNVLCSADMYAMVPTERLLSEFLLLFLLSDAFTRFAVLESDRVAMPKVNQESLKDCWIPLPPISEQQVIVERVFAALKDVDALLDESNRMIDLLFERRSALISAAVTGQLDLRNWQPSASERIAEMA